MTAKCQVAEMAREQGRTVKAYWRLEAERGCGQTRKKDWYWFALDDTQPLFAFAGLWCDWYGIRGTPVNGQHRLYAFLTTEPNGVVEPIHSKAMPAILTAPEEFDSWLSAPIEEALRLQRPLPDAVLNVVGMGREADKPQPSQLSLTQIAGG